MSKCSFDECDLRAVHTRGHGWAYCAEHAAEYDEQDALAKRHTDPIKTSTRNPVAPIWVDAFVRRSTVVIKLTQNGAHYRTMRKVLYEMAARLEELSEGLDQDWVISPNASEGELVVETIDGSPAEIAEAGEMVSAMLRE